jgi:hypothetical protein
MALIRPSSAKIVYEATHRRLLALRLGIQSEGASKRIARREISIWMVDGRQKMRFVGHPRAQELLSGVRGEADLCLIQGKF